ncbi:MAG: choice-of-anchor D domain-containing protein [Planctomycetales bacterium]
MTNTGTRPLTFTLGAIPASFTSSLAVAATVTPGESITFGITMTAAAVGDFDGDILFTTDDLDEDEFSFRLAGSVADSVIVDDEDAGFAIVSGDWNHDVGAGFEGDFSSTVGSSVGFATWTFTGLTAAPVTKTFTLTNNSAAGNDITLTGPITPPPGFSLVQSSVFGTDAIPLTLTPGMSTSFELQFDTGVAGDASGRVSITTDVPTSNPFDFTVTGAGSPLIVDDSDVGAGFTVVNGTIVPNTAPFTQTAWSNFTPGTNARDNSYLLKSRGTGNESMRLLMACELSISNLKELACRGCMSSKSKRCFIATVWIFSN